MHGTVNPGMNKITKIVEIMKGTQTDWIQDTNKKQSLISDGRMVGWVS